MFTCFPFQGFAKLHKGDESEDVEKEEKESKKRKELKKSKSVKDSTDLDSTNTTQPDGNKSIHLQIFIRVWITLLLN